MEKSLILLIEEFKQNLLRVIENSGLPMFSMVDSIKTLLPILENKAIEQYNAELQAYNQALAEMEKAESEQKENQPQ